MSEPPSLPGVTHEWIDIGDGLRIHVALAGPEDAPPLLMVHGWPQHWWAWRHVIPALSARYRIIAADLRGHGWSDAPPKGYDKAQLATDMLALLDRLGIEKVTWLGHDWGAFSGFLAALRAPERFERFVPLGVPAPFNPDRSLRTFLLIAGYQVPIGAPLLGPFIVRHGVASRILRAARARGSSWTDEEVRTYDDVFRSRPWVSVQVYRSFFWRELPKLARGPYDDRTLEVPTTLLVGGKDLVTRTIGPDSYPDQPNLTVQSVEGVGHFIAEEAPDAVIAALS